jgi:hypothetical protein
MGHAMQTNITTLDLLLHVTGGALRIPLKAVARILGLEVGTIHNQISKGKFPLTPIDPCGEHKRIQFDVIQLAAYLDRTGHAAATPATDTTQPIVIPKRRPGRPPKSEKMSLSRTLGR